VQLPIFSQVVSGVRIGDTRLVTRDPFAFEIVATDATIAKRNAIIGRMNFTFFMILVVKILK
jgi:hypothetical protein